MLNIDFNNLNPLEKQIHETLYTFSKTNSNITITESAKLCNCSISKISKFVKKLGFTNYKQYIDFLYFKKIEKKDNSNELMRIKNFIETFDSSITTNFVHLLNSYKKIILFGYGPSLICCQYFEYKLRLVSDKFIIALCDEVSLENLLDENTLLIIFSTTGKFKSFENINNVANEKNSTFLLITEEYNPYILQNYDNVISLSNVNQDDSLKPYQKTRTIFFIFIEEVISKFIVT